MNLSTPGLLHGVLFALLIGVASASADTIYFKNGRHMEGIIEKVTAKEVTVRVGLSTVTLKRSQIKGVKRDRASDKKDLDAEWREKYFAHSKYAPEGYQDLAARYRSIESTREVARTAADQVESIKSTQQALYSEAKQRADEIHKASVLMQDLSPEHDPIAYRDNLFRYNAAIARLQVINADLDDNGSRIQELMSQIATYTTMLTTFKKEFHTQREAHQHVEQDNHTMHFFEAIERSLRLFEDDFELETVDAVQRNGQMVVSARINDETAVSLLVDTGASVVALSRSIGERLGMIEGRGGTMSVTLADGSKADAEPVMLKSVQVGDFRAENVEAVILPDSLSDGIDGLLGMSFLREFSMEYDTRSRHLLLKRYRPGE